MNYLTRWQGSTNPEVLAGTATFTAGGQSVSVGMCSFEDARAVEALIGTAVRTGQVSQIALMRGGLEKALEDLTP